MLARDQNRPLKREADGITRRPKREDIGDCYAIVDVQFTLSAVVEQAKCRVAALLNLGKDDASADSMNRTGRNDDDVACGGRAPIDEIGNRAVFD